MPEEIEGENDGIVQKSALLKRYAVEYDKMLDGANQSLKGRWYCMSFRTTDIGSSSPLALC